MNSHLRSAIIGRQSNVVLVNFQRGFPAPPKGQGPMTQMTVRNPATRGFMAEASWPALIECNGRCCLAAFRSAQGFAAGRSWRS